MTNRTEELIAFLEAEIASRDALIEEQAREIERIKADYCEAFADYMVVAREIAALKAQPSGVVLTDDIRAACQNAVEVFAEEPNAAQCREVAEYMREVLLAALNSSTATAGWMMPTAQQLEQALDSVPSFHDLSAELIAPAMLEHLRGVISAGEYGDAYQGAREDLAIWKRRALEAETKIREQDQVIDNLGNALNAENGPTFMGEPVFSAGVVDERAAFEAAFEGEFFKSCFELDVDGNYAGRGLQGAWMGWQKARAALYPKPDHSAQMLNMVPDYMRSQDAFRKHLESMEWQPGMASKWGDKERFRQELLALFAVAPSPDKEIE